MRSEYLPLVAPGSESSYREISPEKSGFGRKVLISSIAIFAVAGSIFLMYGGKDSHEAIMSSFGVKSVSDKYECNEKPFTTSRATVDRICEGYQQQQVTFVEDSTVGQTPAKITVQDVRGCGQGGEISGTVKVNGYDFAVSCDAKMSPCELQLSRQVVDETCKAYAAGAVSFILDASLDPILRVQDAHGCGTTGVFGASFSINGFDLDLACEEDSALCKVSYCDKSPI